MVGSLLIGERRIDELIERYGREHLALAMAELQRYAERRMRAGIRAIPNGVYRATIAADDDGVVPGSYPIELALAVLDEDVVLDFRGSAGQAAGPINCPYVVTLAACANALFNLVDPTIPHNEGAFRPIHLIAPPGTIVNCDYPAPLSAGNTESHNLVVEVVLASASGGSPRNSPRLQRVRPPVSSPAAGHHPVLDEFYAFVIWEPTGYGARHTQDGYTVTTWVAPQARPVPDRGDRDRAALARRRVRAAPGFRRRWSAARRSRCDPRLRGTRRCCDSQLGLPLPPIPCQGCGRWG